jgi:hypothetical protein
MRRAAPPATEGVLAPVSLQDSMRIEYIVEYLLDIAARE